MSRYGVSPNMLILPPQMLLYMALAPEQKLTYKEGGPAAEARFEAGVAGARAQPHTATHSTHSDRPFVCLTAGRLRAQASRLAPSAAAASSPAVPRAFPL